MTPDARTTRANVAARLALAIAVAWLGCVAHDVARSPHRWQPALWDRGGVRALAHVILADHLGTRGVVALGCATLAVVLGPLLVAALRRPPMLAAVAGGALVVRAAIALHPTSEVPRGRRSALVLLLDGLRTDRVDARRMPRLTALARGGLFATRARIASVDPDASLRSWLTGATPARHGVRRAGEAPHDASPSVAPLPARVRRAGGTAWLLADATTTADDLGFDRVDVLPGARAAELASRALARLAIPGAEPRLGVVRVDAGATRLTPESPWVRGADAAYRGRWKYAAAPAPPGELPRDERDRVHLDALADAQLAEIDAAIGVLADALARAGSEAPLLAIASLRGSTLAEPPGTVPPELRESALEVPLVVVDPRTPARRTDAPVRAEDLAPTLAARLGLPAAGLEDGTPLDLRAAASGELAHVEHGARAVGELSRAALADDPDVELQDDAVVPRPRPAREPAPPRVGAIAWRATDALADARCTSLDPAATLPGSPMAGRVGAIAGRARRIARERLGVASTRESVVLFAGERCRFALDLHPRARIAGSLAAIGHGGRVTVRRLASDAPPAELYAAAVEPAWRELDFAWPPGRAELEVAVDPGSPGPVAVGDLRALVDDRAATSLLAVEPPSRAAFDALAAALPRAARSRVLPAATTPLAASLGAWTGLTPAALGVDPASERPRDDADRDFRRALPSAGLFATLRGAGFATALVETARDASLGELAIDLGFVERLEAPDAATADAVASRWDEEHAHESRALLVRGASPAHAATVVVAVAPRASADAFALSPALIAAPELRDGGIEPAISSTELAPAVLEALGLAAAAPPRRLRDERRRPPGPLLVEGPGLRGALAGTRAWLERDDATHGLLCDPGLDPGCRRVATDADALGPALRDALATLLAGARTRAALASAALAGSRLVAEPIAEDAPSVHLRFAGAGAARRVGGSVAIDRHAGSLAVRFRARAVGGSDDAIRLRDDGLDFALTTLPGDLVGIDLAVEPPTAPVRWSLHLDDAPWPEARAFGGKAARPCPALAEGLEPLASRLCARAERAAAIDPRRDLGLFVSRDPVGDEGPR